MVTFQEYLLGWAAYTAAQPWYRVGQSAFNHLWQVCPELRTDIDSEIAGKIHKDPFYLDRNLPVFLLWVQEHLK